jgi:predicted membrane protein
MILFILGGGQIMHMKDIIKLLAYLLLSQILIFAFSFTASAAMSILEDFGSSLFLFSTAEVIAIQASILVLTLVAMLFTVSKLNSLVSEEKSREATANEKTQKDVK